VTNHFNSIIDSLKVRLRAELPGRVAHEPLRAFSLETAGMEFEHAVPPKLNSVLILLYEESLTIKFPLIKRPIYIGAHSGQISLPGGKAEPGEDFFKTALRETEEEIGVEQTRVEVLGKLTDFHVLPSNFMVSPIVGILRESTTFKPDPFEVEKIIFGTLNDLMKKDAVKQREIVAGGKYRMMAPYFEIENEVVWGATAMILNELRLILQEIA
jgi:8-oxo-dGTP pyrophosphatase MutT (NUDIX family)